MFRPTLETKATERPVTRDECKRNGVIDHNEDDLLIEQYIRAATDHLDGFRGVLGRCMVSQTWKVEAACFERCFVLPVPDVTNVEIRYLDESDTQQILPAQEVNFHSVELGTMVLIDRNFTLPATSQNHPAPVTVSFTAGFGAAKDVPWALKLAVMQMVRQMFDDRGGQGSPEMNSWVKNLISPYRWVRI